MLPPFSTLLPLSTVYEQSKKEGSCQRSLSGDLAVSSPHAAGHASASPPKVTKHASAPSSSGPKPIAQTSTSAPATRNSMGETGVAAAALGTGLRGESTGVGCWGRCAPG